MKKILSLLSSIVTLILITNCFVGCKKNGSSTVFNTEKMYTLEQPGQIDNNLYLPKGTQWRYVSDKGTEVKFVLPKGYAFLMKNNTNGTYVIDPIGGGYSCTCSGKSGSCTVFNNKDVGYGCLQSNCSGSCTGTPTTNTKKIVGVLNIKNSSLDFVNSYERASLSEEGIAALLHLPEVQQSIRDYYDLLYTGLEKPDFENVDVTQLSKGMKVLKGQIYGFQIALLINKNVQQHIKSNMTNVFARNPMAGLALMNNTTSKYLETFTQKVMTEDPNPPSITCTCSNGSRGGSCEVQSKGAFGYKVYYCTGCTICTMNNSNN